MSEPVSPLNQASYEGYVRIETMGLQGMITLRGDLSSAKLKKAVKAVAGVAVPAQRKVAQEGDKAVAWMSPDEVLILVPYAGVADAIAALEKDLSGEHFLAVDVSDARAMFRLSGASVREVVAKVMPVDMRPSEFAVGDFRRSRLAQVAAAMWMPAEDAVQIICFRSVADYAFGVLKDAAETGGEVGAFG
jgi:sarcosine oxidase subunit gamma